MKIHFIGIGGIGISALAKYYLEKDHQIVGSDLISSEITQNLKKLGVKIFIGKHKIENLPKNIDLVIYSPAVQPNNPELKAAKKLGIKCLSYPEALGELTKEYFTIAITGTHGKSTTTVMIGSLLVNAGLDPTVIVGTKVKEFGNSNCQVGKSKYLVIEACEYEESFLNYSPDIAIITNIEPEHLDYFKNFNNIKKAFAKFTKKLKKNGILITESEETLSLLPSSLDLRLTQIKQYKNLKDAKKIKEILKVPGKHNISNALAALATARILKIPDKISFNALSKYNGCWRRFEVFKITQPKQYILISDYGHHPTELKATLRATREKYPDNKIYCIFQPHQYYRTYYLFNDFVKVCQNIPINKLIITDIYTVAGREKESIKKKISSEKLVKAIKKSKVIYLPKEKIISYLKEKLKRKEIIIIMGAGDIYELVIHLTKKEKREKIK